MGDACCGSAPDIEKLRDDQRGVLKIVLAINAATFLMMLASSIASGSVSLLSGGLDNLGDALTYGMSLAVVGASARAKARVALLKAALIVGAAVAVALQLAWRIRSPSAPVLEPMSIAALLNLAANGYCLYLLTPFRKGDINMSSSWECSRNDVAEGVAVLAAAGIVWLTGSGWPDIIAAAALLVLFLRSAVRVARDASAQLRQTRT